MAEWLEDLLTLPRDGVIVTNMSATAEVAAAYGRRALLQGRDFTEYRDLRDDWSTLSRRTGIAQAIGTQGLCDAVCHFTNVTHINRNTSINRARRWAEHLIRNLLLLSESPHGMRAGAFRGLPAFVVGAGPSLDRNRDLLRHAPGPVIRVNAASKAAPGDFTLSVESNDLTDKLADDGVQLLGITTPPHVMRARSPLRPVWVGEIGWVLEKLTGLPRLATSGGGTGAAVSLAHRWGCDPIVLVGQDLAWTNGRVYAEATGFNDRVADDGTFEWAESAKLPRPSNPLPEKDDLMRVTAWGGEGTVLCGTAHHSLRMWLAAFSDSVDVRCINATEGGSRVPGWEEQKLDVQCWGERGIQDPGHAHDCAGQLIPRDAIVDWLRNHAANELAETWAYRSIAERIDEHRSRAPLRVPVLEAWHVRRVMRDVKAIVEQARDEIGWVVEEEICR